MSPLREFQKNSASWKQRVGKPLAQWPEPVPALLDRTAESHAMGFPFLAHRFDIIDFQRNMLNTRTKPFDEFGNLRFPAFVPALHQGDSNVVALHHNGIHA